MIALLQRVTEAQVRIGTEQVGEIGRGLAVLVAVERGDGVAEARRLAERLLDYRVFPDGVGRMDRCVRDIGGGILLVPQFTLAADTQTGNRPSFTPAAPPEEGRALFAALVFAVSARHAPVVTGRFGADMQVALVNDGPVTFWLRVDPPRK